MLGQNFLLGDLQLFSEVNFTDPESFSTISLTFKDKEKLTMHILGFKKDEYMLLYSCVRPPGFLKINVENAWLLSRKPFLDSQTTRSIQKFLFNHFRLSSIYFRTHWAKSCRSQMKSLTEKRNNRFKRWFLRHALNIGNKLLDQIHLKKMLR